MLVTANCVICYKTLYNQKVIGGHVHQKDKIILVALCNDCHDKEPLFPKKDCEGCFGDYNNKMGVVEHRD